MKPTELDPVAATPASEAGANAESETAAIGPIELTGAIAPQLKGETHAT